MGSQIGQTLATIAGGVALVALGALFSACSNGGDQSPTTIISDNPIGNTQSVTTRPDWP